MRIQGYTFDASFYCVSCAQAAWVGRTLGYPRRLTLAAIEKDENGIPMGAVDSEGNTIHPVFVLDELDVCECASVASAA